MIAKVNYKTIANPNLAEQQHRCNCRNKFNCGIPCEWFNQCLVYKVSTNNVNYIGMTEGEFKTRHNNHSDAFREPTKRDNTTLLQFIWEKNLNP